MDAKELRARVLTRRCRIVLAGFVVGLLLSGLTAVPLQWGVGILNDHLGVGSSMEQRYEPMARWISLVHSALADVGERWPFIYYGTDWLAFAHLVIAIAFLGPLRDPVRNVWVVQWAMIACVLVIPMALIFGPVRGIPFFWRVIDCCFGVVGIIPLGIAYLYIIRIRRLRAG